MEDFSLLFIVERRLGEPTERENVSPGKTVQDACFGLYFLVWLFFFSV